MAEAKYDVLAIGNAIVDVLARVEDGLLEAQSLTKGSMRLIDEAEADRLYGAMGPAVEVSGGSAANTIAGLASFGGRGAFIGKVRDDQLGHVFAHDIRAEGVAFTTPSATEGPTTARCLILVTPDGQRTMNTFLGASSGLSPADIDGRLVADAGVTYLEGYLWDPPLAKEAFVKAAQAARGAGRKVALTLSDSFCVDRHRQSFLDLIRSDVDMLFANEAEIGSLYQVKSFDQALAKVRSDCRLAVLTRSEKGCVVVDGEALHEVPAVPGVTVVDTTGAGDLFASGFLAGYARGAPLRRAAELGVLAAAEVISHLGARPQTRLDALVRKKGLV
ncbi:MAG: adenosine kinase [Parvibaculaceae bacterium]